MADFDEVKAKDWVANKDAKFQFGFDSEVYLVGSCRKPTACGKAISATTLFIYFN
ncbi:hypothetical protein [Comamonas testosteroni]|uniref:hypothetical protein n=1 Tax=Comamonas testosteroni TaxID=285 RepID=UPI001884BC44|nr:hypothetical protein [Comamonas testosteroni]